MFTKPNTKLDRAVILSMLAMLTCTVLVQTRQLDAVPQIAAASSAPALQT